MDDDRNFTSPGSERDLPENPTRMAQLSSNGLFHAMRWLFTAMKLLGMVHFDNITNGSERNPSTRWSAAKIYQVVVILLLILNQVRLLFLFNASRSLDPQLFLDVTIFCWMSMALVNAMTMYTACNCKGRLFATLTKWHSFNQQPSPEKMAYFTKKCRWYVIFGLGTIPLNIAFELYAFLTTSMLDGMHTPIKRDNDHINLIRGLYMVFHIIIVGYFSLPSVYVLFLTDVAHYELKHFNAQFRQCISKGGDFQGDLEEHRRRHLRICVFIEEAEATVSLTVGFSFLATILEILLILYDIIWWSDLREHTGMMIIFISWFTFAVLYITVMFIFCAYVNHEVLIFVSRLTGRSIGFTASSMFVIDKPVLLTIMGVIVSYFFLIIQFASDETKESANNITTSTAAALW
ncbi:hypothetical protein CAPTEDRAFT_184862 [Capitella teleta]|uniref:Gustatory receptor n=1 Tax=Capitella teleta TaxID=283909 RepID=X1ZH68_CAPTE|nr:hypothetical protein CAPTEDRAFT_184862 [Capitella teleta]|eukprot:ELT90076.1 hypothetical protein CAPTEDRAFT_184862 [Capitella teleta]